MNRSYKAATIFGTISRGLSVLIRFAAVPMTVTLLSQERYGLWLIISALIGWFGFSDLGIPSALQNKLISVLRAEDITRARALVAFSLRLLIGVAVVILLCGVIGGIAMPWGAIFKVEPGFRAEFAATLILCLASFAIGLPSRVGGAVYNAHGSLAMQPLTDVIVQVASFGMLAMAVAMHWHSLLALVSCSIVGVLVGPVLLTLLALRKYHYSAFGADRLDDTDKRSLIGKGFFFFVTVIGELLILQSDAFVIGAMLGAVAVPLFMIPNTLWLNFLQTQNIFLRPLWPPLSHAYAAGEVRQLRKVIGRALLISIGCSLLFATGLILLGNWFIHLWSKGMVSLPPVMAWGFAIYAIVASVDNVMATCLNAFGLIEVRFGYTLLFGFTKVAMAIAVLHFATVQWLPWGFCASMAVTSIPFAVAALRKALSRLELSQQAIIAQAI